MNTIEAIKSRRSIRKFKPITISHDLLEQVVNAAAYAPSWKNTQITRYIAIEDITLKNRIADECCYLNHNGDIIKDAPLLVICTMIGKRSGYERDGSFSTGKGSAWQMFDSGVASQTFALAAHELGLSTVIMGIYEEEKLISLINPPENQEISALIAVGFSDEEPPAPSRKSITDLLSYR